jgi:predicted DNA-binding transcriptional regulator AlpA
MVGKKSRKVVGKKSGKVPGGDRPRNVRWTSAAILEWQRQSLLRAGQDPAVVPEEQFRFLALPEVRIRVGLSVSSIYRAMAAGTFPRPVPIDNVTPRAA